VVEIRLDRQVTTAREETAMSSDQRPEEAKCPECDTPLVLKDRVRAIAARLHDAANAIAGEVMLDIPTRLGDHRGLVVALANELEQLVK
jgi:hypothetical protein